LHVPGFAQELETERHINRASMSKGRCGVDLSFFSEGRVLKLRIVSDSERYLNVFYLRAKRAPFLKCFKWQAATWGRICSGRPSVAKVGQIQEIAFVFLNS
jgi:hypothetical protein